MAEDWFADVQKYAPDADPMIVAGIVRYCGIALRTRDSSLVSTSDPTEVARVRDNFLKKKLGLTQSDADLDQAINAVGEKMAGDRSKNRVTVYYLLAEQFGQLGLFVAKRASKAASKNADAAVEATNDDAGTVAGAAALGAGALGLAATGANAAASAEGDAPTPPPATPPAPVASTTEPPAEPAKPVAVTEDSEASDAPAATTPATDAPAITPPATPDEPAGSVSDKALGLAGASIAGVTGVAATIGDKASGAIDAAGDVASGAIGGTAAAGLAGITAAAGATAAGIGGAAGHAADGVHGAVAGIGAGNGGAGNGGAGGGYSAQVTEGGGGWRKWLPWLVLAALLLLLFLAMRSCKGPEVAGAAGNYADATLNTAVSAGGESIDAAGDLADGNLTDGNIAGLEPAPGATVAIPAGAGVVPGERDGKPMVSTYFDTGKSLVADAFPNAAAALKTYVAAHPEAKVVVSGFADPTGNAALNAALSKKRAQAVAAALQGAGIPAAAIVLEKPADAVPSTTDLAQARRVEAVVK